MGLERWSPRSGCLEEGEKRKEAWVKILGLPISLWVSSILRRVGEECGGFLAIDPQTEKMEDLQWVCILVKTNGEDLPSMLDIGVEEACYPFSLWWEIRLVLRKASSDSRYSNGRTRGEVRGDVAARATSRLEELENARLEALLLPVDGTDGQDSGAGGEGTEKRVQVGSMARVPLDPPKVRPSSSGLSMGLLGSKQAGGPSTGLKLKRVVTDGDGLSSSKAKWRADVEVSPALSGVNGLIGDCLSPSQTESFDRNISEKPCSLAHPVYCNGSNFEAEFFKLQDKEDAKIDYHFTLLYIYIHIYPFSF